MAVQTDGRIILVGSVTVTTGKGRNTVSQDDIVLIRLLANGSLDASFGQGGKVTMGVSTAGNMADGARAVAIQGDGKIVVGARTYGSSASGLDSILLRYNGNGSLDSSFGQGGKVVTAWSAGDDGLSDIAIQADGRIVVTGKGYQNSSGNNFNPYFVARYNANGSLDDGSPGDATPGDSFGSGGVVATPFGSREVANGVLGRLALQPDGGIVFARHSFNGTDNDIALARFTATGALDTSFGGGTGMVRLDLGGNQVASGVAVQGDGKIVISGYSDSATGTEQTLVARFQPDGVLEVGFGTGGVVINSFSSGSNELSDVALQADGKIVAVGAIDPPTGGAAQPSFVTARFQGNSAPALRTTAIAPAPTRQALTSAQTRPALAQALAYWRAHGADTSRLGHIDIAIADLGANRLGEASGSTIKLDDNAAGWGWNVARSAGRGRKALAGGMSLLSALVHEVGHLLGHEHSEGGVMAETLAPGARPALPVGPAHVLAPTIVDHGPVPSRFGVASVRSRRLHNRISHM